MTLPQDVAAMAESIVNTLTQTDYQHVDNIDPNTGVYDCDCSRFAAFIPKEQASRCRILRRFRYQHASGLCGGRGPEQFDIITVSSLR